MATGYEVKFYADVARIADNLGRIANALEQQVYGISGQGVRDAEAELRRMRAEGGERQ